MLTVWSAFSGIDGAVAAVLHTPGPGGVSLPATDAGTRIDPPSGDPVCAFIAPLLFPSLPLVFPRISLSAVVYSRLPN